MTSLRSILSAGLTALALLSSSFVFSGRPAGAAAIPDQTTSGAPAAANPGYWIVGTNGAVYQFGTTNFGGMQNAQLKAPIVGGAATPDGLGYWMVGSDGGIFSFGDASFYGSTGNITLAKPIVGMAADPETGGYWMVASDGGIFSFNAPFFGSTGNVKLTKPVVGMAVTPDGKGYWLVASDGGIFTFGDAGFYGSTGSVHLFEPIVGMTPTPDGKGYWLVASDGGVFTFGDAGFFGSAGGVKLAAPVVSIASSPDGQGYWLTAADGGVFTYGDAQFLGSPAGRKGGSPSYVGMLETNNGYPFPPGATGYDISQYQCPQNGGTIPSTPTRVAVVQVSGGSINSASPNPCYTQEAQWAGDNISAYIFMDQLPSPAPPESLTGPAGTCTGDVDCESYNFGYYWAKQWVAYSRNQGVAPSLWWLDVEGPSTWWASRPQDSNSAVISGAVAGLRASSVIPGIYSTNLQWGQITGGQVSFPGIALWVPGAGDISDGSYSAQNFCTNSTPQPGSYGPFAGGNIVLVQYGYSGNGYSGSASPYDQDYACL
jgi:hypothetical protein